MWAIRGRIVPLTSDPTVAPNEAAVFTGRVWIGDDGTIVTVTKGTKAGPPGSDDASVIDVGSSLVLPGLIDLHNHLAYNTLPLWTEPHRQTPFAASQLLDQSRDLRRQHHLARVRADHRMPAGVTGVRRGQGGLPKDLDELVIPPLQSLTHDDEWLDSVVGRGFHSGVLDGLATFYRR